MKKISIALLVTLVLVLGFTMTVSAAADDISAKVYFDNWIGGNTHYEDINTYDYDTQCSFFGFELNAAQIKFGAEFGMNASTKDDSGANYDYDMTNYKIGFRVVDGRRNKLDVTLSTLKFDGDAFGGDACTGTLLGADLNLALSKQIFFQASYAFSLDASWSGVDSVKMSSLNCKVGDLVTENIAITAGYRLYRVDGEMPGYDLTRELSGLTLGVMCKF